MADQDRDSTKEPAEDRTDASSNQGDSGSEPSNEANSDHDGEEDGEPEEEDTPEARFAVSKAANDELRRDPMKLQGYYQQALPSIHPAYSMRTGGSFGPTTAVLETTELLEQILIHLRLPDLLTCQAVSSKFKAVITGSPLFKESLWMIPPYPLNDAGNNVNYHVLEPGKVGRFRPSPGTAPRSEQIRPGLKATIRGCPRIRYMVPQLDEEFLQWGSSYINDDPPHTLSIRIKPSQAATDLPKLSCMDMYLSDCDEPLYVHISRDVPKDWKRSLAALDKGSGTWISITLRFRPTTLGMMIRVAKKVFLQAGLPEQELIQHTRPITGPGSEYLSPSGEGFREMVPSTLSPAERQCLIGKVVLFGDLDPDQYDEEGNWTGRSESFHGSEIDWENDADDIERREVEMQRSVQLLAELAIPRHLCRHCLQYVLHPEDLCYNRDGHGDKDGAGIPWALWQAELQQYGLPITRDPLMLTDYKRQALPTDHPARSPDRVHGVAALVTLGDTGLCEQIMSHLNLFDLLRCGRVCRRFRLMIWCCPVLRELGWLQFKPQDMTDESTGAYFRAPTEQTAIIPRLNHYLLSYENEPGNAYPCRVTVNDRGQLERPGHPLNLPKIAYYVPDPTSRPVEYGKMQNWGRQPRMIVTLTAQQARHICFNTSSYLFMYLSDTPMNTWLSIVPADQGAQFEQIDVKVRPAPLLWHLRIACQLYLEAVAAPPLPLHTNSENWERLAENFQAKPFEPRTLSSGDWGLIVSEIGCYRRYDASSKWIKSRQLPWKPIWGRGFNHGMDDREVDFGHWDKGVWKSTFVCD